MDDFTGIVDYWEIYRVMIRLKHEHFEMMSYLSLQSGLWPCFHAYSMK